MKTINVLTLKKLCENEIKKGNGNKKILISADDEGNSYHELFYSFASNVKEFEDFIYCINKDELKDYIILG